MLATAPPGAAPALERAACSYTSCYCEENALLLSKRLAQAGAAPADRLYVVFVTNRLRQTPLWFQRAGRDEDGLVVWDYHVFVVEAPHGALRCARVWDLDTRLPFPCPLPDYAAATLPPVREEYDRVYRAVPAPHLWRHFASDRSHMRAPGGGWAAPPPPYPPFVAESDGCANRLQAYLDVAEAYPRGGGPGDGSDDDGSGGGSGGDGGSGSGDGGEADVAGAVEEGGANGGGRGSGGGDGVRGVGSGGGVPRAEMGRVMRQGELLRAFGAA
ncbi:MAG: N-terminal glutamine amidase-domain-containing protein [Monoraphidium minutum]|nr:MAG: N-terminal glutamine amidase-domain-containing protein [Monoraphidium minutum]